MRPAVLFLIAGCNQIYGLDATSMQPMPFFDAPTDAPFVCPDAGTTPVFKPEIVPINCPCVSYTESESLGRSAALFMDASSFVVEGPTDGTLVRVTALDQVGSITYDMPRLTPEGDELFARERDANDPMNGNRIRVFQREANNTFSKRHALTLPFAVDQAFRYSTVTRGAVRRMMVAPVGNQPFTHEIEFDGTGVAAVKATYVAGDFGASGVSDVPSLSPDGTRLLMPGTLGSDPQGRVLYTSRNGIAGSFRPAVAIDGVPFAPLTSPFMTETCGRFYTRGDTSIVWLERL